MIQVKVPYQENQVSNFQGTWWVLLICIISSTIVQIWKEALEIRQFLELKWALSSNVQMVSKLLIERNCCDPTSYSDVILICS